MEFLRSLRSASEICFYLVGFLLLVAVLFWRNESFAFEAEMFLRYADLPFAFISILFAGTSLRIALSEYMSEKNRLEGEEADSDNPIIDVLFLVGGLLVFCILVYVDFALPDVM